MQCGGVRAGAEDAGVGLGWGAEGDAALAKGGRGFAFIGGGFKGMEGCEVGGGCDDVGVANEGDFGGVFGDAAVGDGGVEGGGVDFVGGMEVGRERVGAVGGCGEVGVWVTGFEVVGEFCGDPAGVGVVFFEGVGWVEPIAGPDHRGGIEGGDEEGEGVFGDVVG